MESDIHRNADKERTRRLEQKRDYGHGTPIRYMIDTMDSMFSSIERTYDGIVAVGGSQRTAALDLMEARNLRAAPGYHLFFDTGKGEDDVDYLFDRLYGGAK